MDSLVVTIDGPAGSGKSTAARLLAERLGFQFLDTGAMYRVVAWQCLELGVPLDEQDAVAAIAAGIRISFRDGRVFAGDTDVTTAIRTPEVTEGSSIVASNPGVRDGMSRLQRTAAAGMRIVTEGRDQGTVVFPDAFCKFFLTASPETRAHRRYEELLSRGGDAQLNDILQQLLDRDARDEQRKIAPLRAADDAISIDTSSIDSESVVDLLESHIRDQLAQTGS